MLWYRRNPYRTKWMKGSSQPAIDARIEESLILLCSKAKVLGRNLVNAKDRLGQVLRSHSVDDSSRHAVSASYRIQQL